MLKAWILLVLAIICEVLGVSVMHYMGENSTQTIKILTYGFMFLMLGIAYYFMALSIRRINVAVAYAIWEVLGLSLIALISLLVFKTPLNAQEYLGIFLAIVGITLVNIGHPQES